MQTITVLIKDTKHVIDYDPSLKRCLNDILRNNGIILNTACGGHGICRKCEVILCTEAGNEQPVPACTFCPDTSVTVILNETISSDAKFTDTSCNYHSDKNDFVYASADIGSTSVTISINNGVNVLLSASFANPTLAYGADIISRISASMKGYSSELSTILKESIHNTVANLLRRLKLTEDKLISFTIACNNTMQHILLELDCTCISAYPFRSEHLCFNKISYNELFNENKYNASVYIIPSFSTFIGGDIISGLYSLDILNTNDTFMFLDLGTNAEMVIGNAHHMLCTSAASGPAFEAGGLSCGCALSDGAINNIKIKKNSRNKIHTAYMTAGGKIPVGICGSGVLSLLSQLLELKIADAFGTLSDEYIENGFYIAKASGKNIVLTQDDIRQLQLAISAIKTGIQILLTEYGISAPDVKKVYISGSFGSALDFNKISNLKILPDEWLSPEILVTAGNTSLNGAVKYNPSPDTDTYISNIISRLDELYLAKHPCFNDLFLKNINFY